MSFKKNLSSKSIKSSRKKLIRNIIFFTILITIIISIFLIRNNKDKNNIKQNNNQNNNYNITNSSTINLSDNIQKNENSNNLNNKNNDNNNTNNEYFKTLKKDYSNISIFFCNYHNCSFELLKIINSTKRLECAFYDLDYKPLIKILETKNATIILDDERIDDEDLYINISSKITYKKVSGLMHHKFCILDNKSVLTGSMNPTKFGMNRNDNNFLLIDSKILVENYNKELLFLKNKTQTNYNNIFFLNNQLIENYFCSRDCKNIVINKATNLIQKANSSIKIAAFSFTSEEIFEEVIMAQERDIKIQIILEKRLMNSKSSKFQILEDLGIDIIFDSNPGAMHHKFIIIDNEVLFTGSPNFSEGGFYKNSENILIFYNKEVAIAYADEFERLWNLYK